MSGGSRTRLLGLGALVLLALQVAACTAEHPASPPAPGFEAAPAVAAVTPPGAPSREATPALLMLAPPESGALISVADVQQAIRAGQPIAIVDARPLSAYEASHIPGAAHVPAHALATSLALRVEGVVVVSSGHGAGAVPAAVDALRDNGRAARLLDGGMQAWCRAGGAVTGPCRDEDLVGAGDVRSLIGCPGRAIAVVVPAADAAAVERARRVLPDAHVLVASEPAVVAERAADLVRSSGARHLVVLDADGSTVTGLRGPLREATAAHVFFVDGGLAAVSSFESMQAAMLDRRAVVTEGRRGARPSGIGGEAAVVRAPKGCGCR